MILSGYTHLVFLILMLCVRILKKVNGWAIATTHTPLYFVDYIDISNFFDAAIKRKTRLLREKGHTYTEISQLTGIPKSNVFRALRKPSTPSSHAPSKPNKGLNGATPYGYCLHRGALIEDPKEQKVVQIILSHWQSCAGFKSIADILNRQKHVTKMGKPWTYFAVRSVIRRHLSINTKTKEPL